ncbi:hypothetical protein BLOT_009820 [Blomia tropicalis]|nr:hypothetical protein BLOT_009820 [Blomia tropicalis]
MYRCKWRVYSKELTENSELVFVEPGLEILNLPIYSMEHVSKHNNVKYDVSQFLTQNATKLFCIGNFREEDRLKPSDIQVSDPSDEYISERNPVLSIGEYRTQHFVKHNFVGVLIKMYGTRLVTLFYIHFNISYKN